MTLVFFGHAVEQMLKRAIDPKDVEILIAHPDGVIRQSRDKRILYRRFPTRRDNLIAAVVIQQNESILEIITVMHNFEVKK
jgi:hypothetical protein